MLSKALAIFALLAVCMVPAALADYEYDDYAEADCYQLSQRAVRGLDDYDMYDLGLQGLRDSSGSVICRIQSNIGKGGFCDLYVKVRPYICMLPCAPWQPRALV